MNELPGGFQEMPSTQIPRLLLNLLSHPNIDIALAAAEKLHSFIQLFEGDEGDMGVPDLLDNEAKLKIIQSFVATFLIQVTRSEWFWMKQKGMQVYEITTNFLMRCSFKEHDEVAGMHRVLGIIEACLEEGFEKGPLLALNESNLLEWIITVLNENTKLSLKIKLYVSEILILLVGEPKNRFTVLSKHLLPSLVGELMFRAKTTPETSEEREYVRNLFDSLELVLLEVEAKFEFIRASGIALLVELIKMKSFVALKALQALSGCVNECKPAASVLLKSGGLSLVFPILLGKGIKSKKPKEQMKIYHYAVLIIFNLALVFFKSSFREKETGKENEREEAEAIEEEKEDVEMRILFKFKENWYEKLKAILEIRRKLKDKKEVDDKGKKEKDQESESDDEEVEKENEETRDFMTLFMVDFIFGALLKQERKEFIDVFL